MFETRIPVAVITGFLGSGKTTLLNRLIRHPEIGETAVIVNEFGEIGIDHALIEHSEEDTILLSSGCLCCTVRGDLVDTLGRLSLRRLHGEVPAFRRVVIETTGLADPAPIVQTLMSQPVSTRYRLDSVVATADAVNGSATLDNHGEAVKQAAVADRIVLTKTDLAPAAAADGLRDRLRELNPAAPLLDGREEMHPSLIFGGALFDPASKTVDVQAWLSAEAYQAPTHHHHHDVNRHDDRVRAFCLAFDAPFAWNELAAWLDLLASYKGEQLLRVKGLVNVAGQDGPVVIHAVQHLFHPPVVLAAWPDPDRRSRIVFITRDLGREVVERTLGRIRGALQTIESEGQIHA